MSALAQDVKHAVRLLLKHPGFTAIALLALTIGIGANTAIFSVVNTVVLKSLPFDEPDRIMVVLNREPQSNGLGPMAPATYFDWRRQQRSFEETGAAEAWSAALTGQGAPEQIPGLRMTASMFRVLRTQAEHGRVFLDEEEDPGKHRVIVLSHRLWERRFGADTRIIGTKLMLRGEAHEVIGIMPATFAFPQFWASKAQAWVPLSFDAERKASRGGNSLRLFGRLKSGISPAQAQSELSAFARQLSSIYPDAYGKGDIAVNPMHRMVVGKLEPVMFLLLGAVGFVLLIACANVANLLLTRGVARRKELAVRLAIGAGRGRIVRQLLTEAIFLSIAGGALGLIAAYWSVDAIKLGFQNAPSHMSLPRLADLRVDTPVLLFTLAITILTGVLFGLAPALESVRPHVASILRETTRSLGSKSAGRVRSALIAAQVALTFILLIGAGLLVRSFVAVANIDPGFRSSNVLTALVSPYGTSVQEPEAQVQFYDLIVERVAALPGVKSVAAVNHLPLAGDVWGRSFVLEDRPEPAPDARFGAVYRLVSPGYFSTMHIPIDKGREIDASDVNGSMPVAVINLAMKQRYWPNEEAIGKRLKLAASEPWRTVVGVVKNVKQREWTSDADPELYLPYRQRAEHFSSPWSSSMTLVARTSGDPVLLTKPLQSTVWAIDRNILVSDVLTLDGVLSDAVRQPKLFAVLAGIFAVAATLLAAIGIYGVVAHSVAQRTAEMGVRLALGASAPSLLLTVSSDALKLAGVGSVLGMGGALALSQVMGSILFGIEPTDLATFCTVTALILMVTALASYLPARRIVRIDPAAALRYE